MNATEELLDQLSIKVKEVAGSDTPEGAPGGIDELLNQIDAAEESAVHAMASITEEPWSKLNELKESELRKVRSASVEELLQYVKAWEDSSKEISPLAAARMQLGWRVTEHLWLRHGSKVAYHPEIECLIADIFVHAQSNIIGTRFNVSVEGLEELAVWDLGAALLNWQSSENPDIEDWLLDHLTKKMTAGFAALELPRILGHRLKDPEAIAATSASANVSLYVKGRIFNHQDTVEEASTNLHDWLKPKLERLVWSKKLDLSGYTAEDKQGDAWLAMVELLKGQADSHSQYSTFESFWRLVGQALEPRATGLILTAMRNDIKDKIRFSTRAQRDIRKEEAFDPDIDLNPTLPGPLEDLLAQEGVEERLTSLTEKEKEVVLLYVELGDQEEVGRRLSVSQQRIAQILKSARGKMSKPP